MVDSLSGNITDMTVSHLFLELRTKKKTGIVFFEHEDVVKKVYFKDGDVVFSSSDVDDDRLGECLLRAGKITKAQYDASAELVKRTNKKQGTILVELGFITPHELVDGVRLQIRQIILGLFSWRGGTYRFEEGPPALSDIIPLQMSTGNLILECVRGLDWQAVRKSLPSLKTRLRPAADPATLFQSADFTHDQKTVLSHIDGKRSIEEICSLSGAGDFNTLKALYLFLALGMAEKGEIKAEEEMAFAQEAVREVVHEEQKTRASTDLPAIRQMILKAYEEIEGGNHYQILGVTEGSTTGEIKKAYFKLAKLYHPDRHFDLEMQDMKGKLETLFARTTEAYNTLSSQAARDEYDLSRIKGAKKIEFEEDKADRTGTATNQFNRGMKEYKAGNFWGALEAFGWAARLDPINANYFYYLGLTLLEMPRRRHEAEAAFKKAIEMEPSKADYHVALGELYLKSGLKARALTAFKEALNWDPDSARAKEGMLAAGGKEETGGSGIFGKMFKEKK